MAKWSLSVPNLFVCKLKSFTNGRGSYSLIDVMTLHNISYIYTESSSDEATGNKCIATGNMCVVSCHCIRHVHAPINQYLRYLVTKLV